MTAKKRLMFYCQHVLGMGHFIRSTEIVRGLSDFNVTFLNGGEIVPGFDLPASVEVINLPPIKSDAEFRALQPAGGEQSLEEIKAIRAQKLLAEYERVQPDVFVIELFPFGRLKFAFELIPLLERCQASGRTKVVCSLRDILVAKRKQQQFEEQACRIVNEFFDLVLVHSDPRFQRLEETFSSAARLERPVVYTGFVAQTADETASVDEFLTGNDERKILVSIGGGRVGSELIDCAIDASPLLAEVLPHQMLIFGGPYLPEAEFQRLQNKIQFVVPPSGGGSGVNAFPAEAGTTNIKLARYTTNFLSHLKHADLSLSMAGYNTCMNILAAGARAIVHPFTGGDNQEQTLRAGKLHELGLVEVVSGQELNPAGLAEKMAQAFGKPKPIAAALDLNGVEKTAAVLNELLNVGQASACPDGARLKSVLRSALSELQEKGQTVNVFFRDDDVDEDEPTLHRLLDLFADFQVPINLEIIPGRLTGPAISLLRGYCNSHPDLFELNQHGWMHVNHEPEGRKCEFGASRTFDRQLADIRQGREVLVDAFSEAFSPVFTPPWNRCTVATYQALDQLGFRALSKLRSKKPVVGYGFRELSVTLDLFRWKGGAEMKIPEEFIGELMMQLSELDTVGIMLHHKVMDEAAFGLLELLLDELRRSEVIRFHTFQSLLKAA